MDRPSRDGAAVRLPPPLAFLAATIAGWLIHRFGAPLPLALSSTIRIGLTIVMILPGLALLAGAKRLFARTAQDPKPWKPTPEIVSTGVYRWSRNPMYVGVALVQVGIGVGLANGWVVALAPVALAIVYATAVRQEEAYLARKFGDAYLSYKASVRRWL